MANIIKLAIAVGAAIAIGCSDPQWAFHIDDPTATGPWMVDSLPKRDRPTQLVVRPLQDCREPLTCGR